MAYHRLFVPEIVKIYEDIQTGRVVPEKSREESVNLIGTDDREYRENRHW